MLCREENVTGFTETLEIENSLNDWIMMGLRLSEGIQVQNFSEVYNAELNTENINYLFEDGLLSLDWWQTQYN